MAEYEGKPYGRSFGCIRNHLGHEAHYLEIPIQPLSTTAETKEAIHTVCKEMTKAHGKHKDDLFVLYYRGHGSFDDKTGHFGPREFMFSCS